MHFFVFHLYDASIFLATESTHITNMNTVI